MAKLWGGRFSKNTNELVDAFNASINYDKRLYREDIRGSIAHANMLVKCGIIPEADGVKIVAGLQDILKEIEAGNFEFSVALEDIHMNVEARLTEKIGDAGARLHTARSRNDQVALDMHMYMKRQLTEIAELLLEFERELLTVAKKHDKTLMPGYTHLQRAQPITFAHHLLAYFNMLQRDFRRLLGVWDDADIMPLGAGAIAGTTFPIDRFYVAEQLNFANVYANSMDAVSDRDYILNFLSFASVLMMHMSRLSEELCLWSSTEFGFIELDDAFATGSSMMPQKKNPDISELVRGKTGRVYGELMAMLTTLKGLPLTYNKDLQEDKEGLFDAIDTVKFTLQVYRDMIATMTVKTERMKWAVSHDFSNATDLADYLVRKGMPFRKAHAVVGQCVAYAIKEDKFLLDMTLEEYKRFSELFEPDLMQALDPEHCVN
ncbi:MAG: argininosuccinate lyase, partial [Acidaminococcaceae bacterium]|nr:argininosuccinate lyase [Acidaminococcaceae bacterium]